jgi:hypothetical protein
MLTSVHQRARNDGFNFLSHLIYSQTASSYLHKIVLISKSQSI